VRCRLYDRWRGERPVVLDDTRKLLAAALLVAAPEQASRPRAFLALADVAGDLLVDAVAPREQDRMQPCDPVAAMPGAQGEPAIPEHFQQAGDIVPATDKPPQAPRTP